MKNLGLVVVSLSGLIIPTPGVCAGDRVEIRREAREALSRLYSISPAARDLGESSRAVLVFPSIVKARSNIGRQHAFGILFAHGRAIGDYELAAVSYGVAEGGEKFGYALFFMSEDALAYLRNISVWEISTKQVVTIAPSTARIVGHPSQVAHRPAMNDQQEAAPRPDDLTLDPTYRGFIPIPTTDTTKTLSTTTRYKGVYAFAFGRKGLIRGLELQRTKITPIHLE